MDNSAASVKPFVQFLRSEAQIRPRKARSARKPLNSARCRITLLMRKMGPCELQCAGKPCETRENRPRASAWPAPPRRRPRRRPRKARLTARPAGVSAPARPSTSLYPAATRSGSMLRRHANRDASHRAATFRRRAYLYSRDRAFRRPGRDRRHGSGAGLPAARTIWTRRRPRPLSGVPRGHAPDQRGRDRRKPASHTGQAPRRKPHGDRPASPPTPGRKPGVSRVSCPPSRP